MSTSLTMLSMAWQAILLGQVGTAAWRTRPRSGAPPSVTGGTVLLLRPCAGEEPLLERSLGSALTLRCRREVVHRFALASADDPAMPVVRAVIDRLRAAGSIAEVVVAPPPGPNRKAGQLAGALAGDLPEALVALVFVDSDVDLDGVDLDRLIDPLLVPDGPLATWAPPTEVAPRTFADHLSMSVLGGSMQALPLLAGVDPRGLVGKCFALRPQTLDRIGGFGALSHVLGEDIELARRIRAIDGEIRPIREVARSLAGGRTLGAVVDRFARWIRVIRAQRPWLLCTYPLLLAPLPAQLLLAGWIAADDPLVGAISAGGALFFRMGVSSLARRRSGLNATVASICFDLFADPLLLWALARALGRPRFSWRGQPLRIARGGRLLSTAPAAPATGG